MPGGRRHLGRPYLLPAYMHVGNACFPVYVMETGSFAEVSNGWLSNRTQTNHLGLTVLAQQRGEALGPGCCKAGNTTLLTAVDQQLGLLTCLTCTSSSASAWSKVLLLITEC